jgi:hypothetical protein
VIAERRGRNWGRSGTRSSASPPAARRPRDPADGRQERVAAERRDDRRARPPHAPEHRRHPRSPPCGALTANHRTSLKCTKVTDAAGAGGEADAGAERRLEEGQSRRRTRRSSSAAAGLGADGSCNRLKPAAYVGQWVRKRSCYSRSVVFSAALEIV